MAIEDRVPVAIILCINKPPKDISINKKPVFLSEVVVTYKKNPRTQEVETVGQTLLFLGGMRRFSQTLLSQQAFETRIKATI